MRFPVLWVLGFSCFACGGDDASSAPPADAGTDQAGGTNAGGSGGSSGSAASGGSSGNAGNGGNGGSGGASGGGSGGTGGGGSGGASGAGGSAGQPMGDGYIFVQQSAADHQLLATFDVWTSMPLCAFREVGVCRLDLCTPPTVHASAGQIGAAVGAVTRSVTANADAGINQGSWPGQLWQPGENVRFFATGAEVPAFEETVPGPAPFTLIEPAPGASVGVSRTQPLRARWSGGDFGSAVVALVGRSVSTGSPLHVKCSFNAALGEGIVPAEALSDLDPAQRTTLVSFAEGYKRLDRGGWLLRVGARTTSVSATVVLQ